MYLGFGAFFDQNTEKKNTMTRTVLLDIAVFKALMFPDCHYCPVLIVCTDIYYKASNAIKQICYA